MRRIGFLVVALLVVPIAARPALAGGGPETTLVVVNEDSPLSKLVANAYITKRGIHPSHVLRLRGIPNLEVIDLLHFKARILAPVRAFLEAQGLEKDIDLVVYSADFPYGVDYRPEIKDAGRGDQTGKFPVASLTGLTYLHRALDEGPDAYLSFSPGFANPYLRISNNEVRGAHGYRSQYVWGEDGKPKQEVSAEDDEEDADPDDAPTTNAGPLLSVMLGFTGYRGNSTPEVMACIERGIASDGTHPKGTVYLMENKNVRATTRMPFFDKTIKMLEALGGKAERLVGGKKKQDGKCPVDRPDVMGVVAGIASFNWAKCGSVFLPGAIAEHLTSFGAHFRTGSQTKCTEYIRHGATGTCGAVIEPYAIWQKFPLPFMHGYYREGSSLAEAFHQSLVNPYQMLIIGEPLAQPYAHFAEVALASPDVRAPWKGVVKVSAEVKPAKDTETAKIELWIDGRWYSEGAPGEGLELDTKALPDGEHTLRIVAIEDSDVETRSSTVARFRVDNLGLKATLKLPRKPTYHGDEILLKGFGKSAKQAELFLGATSLGTAKVGGAGWRMKVDSGLMDIGTNALQVRLSGGKAPERWTAIEDLEVRPPKELSAAKPKRGAKKPEKPKGNDGLMATVTCKGGEEKSGVITTLIGYGKQQFHTLLGKIHKHSEVEKIVLRGQVHATAEGFYRLTMSASGELTVRIKGNEVLSEKELSADRPVYVGLSCNEDDWLDIEIEYTPKGRPNLRAFFGGETVTVPLDKKNTHH
ncbi:MAG: hypothetical protein GY946_05390 [bacterium]|nr:hypothetical protein [bacterium]